MKAVVLAAGGGARMWPLATDSPKPLLPIGGQPIITYSLKALATAGIRDVGIVAGFKAEMLTSRLGTGAEFGLDIRYLRQKDWTGTASAVSLARDFVQDEPFLALYGDLLVSAKGLDSVLAKSRECSKLVSVVEVNDGETSEYGVVERHDERVTRIVEKPPRSRSDRAWVNAGVYVLDRDIFGSIKRTSKSSRHEYELTASLQQQIRSGDEIKAAKIAREDWMDIGRPWDLLEANERVLKSVTRELKGRVESGSVVVGQVCLEENAVIKSGCHIEGPVYIGKTSSVGPNSRIRPFTSIGDDANIGTSCEIKNSVIMSGSKIPHLSYIGDSVIDAGCNIGAGTTTANIRFDGAPIRINLKDKIVNSGRTKLGAIIGRGVQTGINTSLMPGVRIGPNSYIGPGVVLSDDVPAERAVFLKQSLRKVNRRRVA